MKRHLNRLSSVAVAAACAALVLLPGTPARAAGSQVLHGHVPAAVARLQPIRRLDGTNHLKLAISLPLRDRAGLSMLLRQIYDPTSPNYHHYLTAAQFADRFGPTAADYETLKAFAISNNLAVTGTHPNRTLLDVEGSVADIEKAFHITMRVYQHPAEHRTFFAPDVEPSLDLDLPVLHIGGLDTYVLPRPAWVKLNGLNGGTNLTRLSGSGPSGNYMGYDFRAAYAPGVALTGTGQNVGLLECDGYYTNDILAYESLTGLPNVPLQNVLVDGFNGIPEDSNDVVEVSLDIEMAISMAPGLSNVIVYEASADTPAFIYDLVNRMATDNQAKQISSSWVFRNDAGLDQIFLEFGVQGQSFFEASGDEDAYTPETFQWNDDPYLTLVGGTTLTTSGPGGAWVSETVWNWDVEYGTNFDGVGSGGGISTNYAIPIWQEGISMASDGGSTTMRNIPDVALTADNIFVIANGASNIGVGGTSCAAPLWAGFIALVNQQAVGTGAPTVGFINPAIYAIGKEPGYTNAFHDITTGNNTWSGSPTEYYAESGYDLCTGWGTPAGSGLINTLAPLDVLRISPATGFSAAGRVGGPFTVTSQSYTLTNAGATALNWTLANPASWLSASPGSGTLTPGAAATVTVSLNAAATNLAVGSYSASVWFTNLSDGVGQVRQFALSVISPPAITLQPTNQTVLDGATATFTVGISGGQPLFYQWQANSNNLTDNGHISGSSTSTLTISNVSPADVANYKVIVTNAAGAAVSSNALLTALPGNVDHFGWSTISSPQVFNAPFAASIKALDPADVISTNFSGFVNLVGLASGSGVTSIENFDSGVWPHAPWIYVAGGSAIGTISPTNAHDGSSYGLSDPDWTYRTDFQLGNAGDSLSWWIRPSSSSSGRAYFGFGASANGCWSIVAAPNTSQFILQQNDDFTNYNDVVDLTQAWEGENWYLVSVQFSSPSAIVCNLYGSDGITLLNTLSYGNATGLPGGVAMRSFGGFSLDTIQSGGGLTQMPISPTNAGPFAEGIWSGNITVLQAASNAVLTANDGAGHSGSSIPFNVIYSNQPPIIMSQPTNQTLPVGFNAYFTLAAAGSTPLNYFWSRNGVPIAGATNSCYATNNVQFADSGSQFSCLVSNAYGSTVSSNAMLTVTTNSVLIATTNSWDEANFISDFGYPNTGTYGQTFVPPSQSSVLTSFTVYIENTSAYVNFQFYVMAWQGSEATGPILYQSPETTTAGTSGFQAYTFNTGSLAMTPGATYVAFGSITADFTGQAVWGSPTNYPYTNGCFVFNNNGTDFSLLTNSAWSSYSTEDLAFVAVFGGGSGGTSPPTITQQPASQSVVVGASVTFSVAAIGTAPLSYFWQRNGVFIAAATNSTYTTNNVQLSDSGSQFSCLVSNAYGTTLSSSAVLTVEPCGSPTVINFDDVAAPANFIQTMPLTNQYAALGVIFAGPGGLDGGAILNSNGDFQVTGFSGSNFLAFNANSTLSDGGVPRGPETISFSQPQSSVSLLAGSGLSAGQTLTVSAYNTGNVLLTASTITLASALAPVQVAGNGISQVVVSSPAAVFVLDNLTFAPVCVTSPPSIFMQPTNLTVPLGNNATFTVGASGTAPLSYFWHRNGVFIAAATNSIYTTNDVQLSDSGSQFSCLVSNAYGTALSSNAVLTVTPPSLVQNGGFELGSFAYWTTSGNFESSFVTLTAPYVHSGVYGAELGPGGTLGYISQTLATTVGQRYLVSCWLYCDGETPNEFSVSWNGATLFDQQNVADTLWTNLQFQASATATNTVLTFGFQNNPSYFGLDDIAVNPISVPPPQFQSVTLTNGTISFSWSAQAGQLYQVQYTTNLTQIYWTNLGGVLSTTSSSITITDATAASAQRFYRIVLLP